MKKPVSTTCISVQNILSFQFLVKKKSNKTRTLETLDSYADTSTPISEIKKAA